MNKATIQQNGERVYEAMPRVERCKFSDLRTFYHMGQRCNFVSFTKLHRLEK